MEVGATNLSLLQQASMSAMEKSVDQPEKDMAQLLGGENLQMLNQDLESQVQSQQSAVASILGMGVNLDVRV